MQFRHQRGPTPELLRTAPVTYIVFDLLQLGDEVLLTAPYTRRRALLADLPITGTRVTVPRHFTAEDVDPTELLGAHDTQGRLRYIGDVGTGFTERALDELLDLFTPLGTQTLVQGHAVDRTQGRVDIVAHRRPQRLLIRRAPFTDAENLPLRIFFGTSPLQMIQHVYAERLKTWDDWAGVSAEAEGASA